MVDYKASLPMRYLWLVLEPCPTGVTDSSNSLSRLLDLQFISLSDDLISRMKSQAIQRDEMSSSLSCGTVDSQSYKQYCQQDMTGGGTARSVAHASKLYRYFCSRSYCSYVCSMYFGEQVEENPSDCTLDFGPFSARPA